MSNYIYEIYVDLFQTREICVGDEVEFTAIQEPGSSFANSRLSAIRIKHLPAGTVQFETLMENNVEGEYNINTVIHMGYERTRSNRLRNCC